MSKFSKSLKYPNPADTFAFSLATKESISDTCIFVLDANVLILPYTASARSLDEIRKVYSSLVQQERLFIPAQAAREYLDNRADKLSTAHNLLHTKQSESIKPLQSHPLLDELIEFKELIESGNALNQTLKKYQDSLKKVVQVVKSWSWDDPVSKMYHTVLSQVVLTDEHVDETAMEKDLELRNKLKIPPGYKDGGKEANQIGDLLIWHEILTLATAKNNDVIFVSGDEKADWWHQSSGKNLYPRFELVDEFRRATGGKSFHIISLSDLLKMFDAKSDAVDAVEAVEHSERLASKSDGDLKIGILNALNLTNFFRRAMSEYRSAQNNLAAERARRMRTATDADRDQIWDECNQFDTILHEKLMDHHAVYKTELLLCKEFLSSHFPQYANNSVNHYYSRPTNMLGLMDVIDDLELLAKKCELHLGNDN